MIIGGIDPGKTGFLVLLDTQSNWAIKHKFTFVDKDLAYESVHGLLSKHVPGLVIVEKAQAHACPNAGGAFAFGYTAGQIILGLRLSKVPYKQIVPTIWQKQMLAGTSTSLKPKPRSLATYQQMFPHSPIEPNKRSGKLNPDLIDALLIAVYGVLNYGDVRQIRPWRFAA